jgi:hypothetical protein
MNGRLWRRLQIAGVLLFVVTLGVLAVRATGESARTKAVAEKLLAEDCTFFGDIATAPVPPTSAELGRRIVRDAKRSYDARHCEDLYGPVDVDPDAYRRAPTVTPSPAPTSASSPSGVVRRPPNPL